MTSKAKAPLPERVPFSATPPGETPAIRRWVQLIVWTDRMLTTLLENKVKGGKWHALIDKVYAELNLFTAARKVTAKKNNPQRLPRNHRWPNDFFTNAGLYSLREAHFRFDQSVAGNY